MFGFSYLHSDRERQAQILAKQKLNREEEEEKYNKKGDNDKNVSRLFAHYNRY